MVYDEQGRVTGVGTREADLDVSTQLGRRPLRSWPQIPESLRAPLLIAGPQLSRASCSHRRMCTLHLSGEAGTCLQALFPPSPEARCQPQAQGWYLLADPALDSGPRG